QPALVAQRHHHQLALAAQRAPPRVHPRRVQHERRSFLRLGLRLGLAPPQRRPLVEQAGERRRVAHDLRAHAALYTRALARARRLSAPSATPPRATPSTRPPSTTRCGTPSAGALPPPAPSGSRRRSRGRSPRRGPG